MAIGALLGGLVKSNVKTGKSGKGLKGMGAKNPNKSRSVSLGQAKSAVREGREMLRKKKKKNANKGAPMNAPAGKYSRAV